MIIYSAWYRYCILVIPIADEHVGVQAELWSPWEHMPYLSASEVMIHEEALYQVHVLPFTFMPM